MKITPRRLIHVAEEINGETKIYLIKKKSSISHQNHWQIMPYGTVNLISSTVDCIYIFLW